MGWLDEEGPVDRLLLPRLPLLLPLLLPQPLPLPLPLTPAGLRVAGFDGWLRERLNLFCSSVPGAVVVVVVAVVVVVVVEGAAAVTSSDEFEVEVEVDENPLLLLL